MKNMLKTLAICLISITATNVKADQPMVYTEKGYPYGDLVERAQSVKIFYSENKQDVSCRVEVSLPDSVWRSDRQNTTSKDFRRAPLASCLARVKAKEALAQLYR